MVGEKKGVVKKSYGISTRDGLPLTEETMVTGTMDASFNAAARRFSQAIGCDIIGVGNEQQGTSFSDVGKAGDNFATVFIKASKGMRFPDPAKLTAKMERYEAPVKKWNGNMNDPLLDEVAKTVQSVPTKDIDKTYSFSPLDPKSRMGLVLKSLDKDSRDAFTGITQAVQSVYGAPGQKLQIVAKDSANSVIRLYVDPETGQIDKMEKGLLRTSYHKPKPWDGPSEELKYKATEAKKKMDAKKTGEYQTGKYSK